MSLHRRPDGSQVNVGLLRHALLGGTSLVSTPAAYSTDFTSLTALPAGVSLSRASNAMVFDSTGALTYAPNNLLVQSNNFIDVAWNKDTGGSITATGLSDPFGGTTASTFTAGANGSRLYQGVGGASDNFNSIWIRRRTGTGAVTLWQNGGNVDVTASVSGTWARFALKTTLGGYGNYCLLTLGTSGDAIDICSAQTEAVTYETSPRTYNPTTTAAYYGPRFDHAWNGSAWVAKGFLNEEQRTNLYLQSGSPANQTITVASGTTYTVSFYGTGTLTLSGAATQTMNGTGANVRTSYTFAASTTSLTIAVSGTITYPQAEAGSFATSPIPTTGAAVTRSADIPSSSSPLTAYLAAGPSVWEFQDEATGATSRTAYAAGAFDWPVNKWYRSMGVYPAGTDTSSHMTVGGAY